MQWRRHIWDDAIGRIMWNVFPVLPMLILWNRIYAWRNLWTFCRSGSKKNCLCLCHLRKGTRIWSGRRNEVKDALNDVSKDVGVEVFREILIDLLRVVLLLPSLSSPSIELIFFHEIIALRVKDVPLKNWLDLRRQSLSCLMKQIRFSLLSAS